MHARSVLRVLQDIHPPVILLPGGKHLLFFRKACGPKPDEEGLSQSMHRTVSIKQIGVGSNWCWFADAHDCTEPQQRAEPSSRESPF